MRYRLSSIAASIAVFLCVAGLVTTALAGSAGAPAAPQAGAPTVVSYQGQVMVSGVAYTGTGYFKFSVVDLPACTTGYWMNDGSPVSCTAPAAAVSLAVSNGLFNVLLGDTTVTNMTALPASVFGQPTRYLRVWFSSDNITFTQLASDRRIAAVPYALQATNADFLDGQHGSFYLDATNLNAGTVATDRYSAWDDLGAEGYLGNAAGDLARNNGTLQTTLNADLLDSLHASAFQQKYDNVVVVAKSGGDYTTIGAALAAISASAADRYLIWVAPGVYTESVTMEPYVDIQGAGEGVTKITYGGSGGWNLGTVIGADNAELRFLTVENTGGAAYAIAIVNSSASPRISHVTCVSSGGTNTTFGVRNYTGSPAMTDVSVSASSASGTVMGIHNGTSSAPELTQVTVSASGANTIYGILNEIASTPTLRDVTARASGGDVNTAVRNESPVTMLDVVASASGSGTSSNYGVYNTDVVTMTHVTASASGGHHADGIFNTGAEVIMQSVNASGADASNSNWGISSISGSTVTMTQVIAVASGSGSGASYAIANSYDSTATMMQVTARATGGNQNYGIYNSSASASLNNSTVSATGAGANYGVYNYISSGSYTVTINNSQITGSTSTISIYAGFTVRVGASQLAGGNISGTGTATCVGVYDENFASAGYTTCP